MYEILVGTAVLVACLYTQHRMHKREITKLESKLLELDVRIAARIEDRLTVVEQDMHKMEIRLINTQNVEDQKDKE
ncbi:hypothetical protein D9K81_14830 [Acinetobacter chengduensis]|uniref:Phage shock protein B n=1 Tax=Acinetobacter chengduensis TaxID=2420890 RepID=A0ABX9TSM7_9GAMM|nr:hypothetical protein D9K81_14830 [Acinetobacter chengduensis]